MLNAIPFYLLTIHLLVWSSDLVGSTKTQIVQREQNSFFFNCTAAYRVFDFGKLYGLCSSSTDLKIKITHLRNVNRSAIFLSNNLGAINKK